jgi:hypothetical protein
MRIFLAAALAILSSCNPQPPANDSPNGTEFGQFSFSIGENSGMEVAPSRIMYTVEDSGNDPIVFKTVPQGGLICRLTLPVENNDWEDVASGPCPENKAQTCIFVGDIGDGNPKPVVHYFPETEEACGKAVLKSLRVKYADGDFDAESLAVDPQTGDILIGLKTYDGEDFQIVKLYPDGVARHWLTVPGVTVSIGGMDISPDGQRIVITHSENTGRMWVVDRVGRAKEFQVKALGQMESVTFLNDTEILYGSEDDRVIMKADLP